ncbi:MAG: polysaccharide pyruvyl transferase family protein [Pseudorhodobacter sp.]
MPVREHLQNAIIGGGQLFSQLSLTLGLICEVNPDAKVIAWGVGLPPAGRRDKLVREVAQDFALFGTRNYDRREQLSFVPCASCLSPLFDQVAPPRHEVVFFLHRRKGAPVDPPPDAPVLTNAFRPPRDVIDFIASGETVVTSSYHGVYWAQLLGRRVVCLPYNDKFKTFQHRPTMVEPDNWQAGLTMAGQTAPLLEEYRALNHAFAQQALDIWNG